MILILSYKIPRALLIENIFSQKGEGKERCSLEKTSEHINKKDFIRKNFLKHA
ncbi:hypothetical protein [Chlamydiifrater phoenicopteri]|uniref:hypothetical protein n=1 Tax=Chlamydiifrater phoenicopteri TaxID=2681469 RepID=UPI001BD093A9|nr:hypothetical protein [Chlamydiifrater phoenicopteri]